MSCEDDDVEPVFDDAKVKRIVDAFMLALRSEDATAGEACSAASFVFSAAIDQSPSPEYRESLRAACINSIRGWNPPLQS